VSAPTNEFIITFKKGKQSFEEYFLNSLEPVKERGGGRGGYASLKTVNFTINFQISMYFHKRFTFTALK